MSINRQNYDSLLFNAIPALKHRRLVIVSNRVRLRKEIRRSGESLERVTEERIFIPHNPSTRSPSILYSLSGLCHFCARPSPFHLLTRGHY